MVVLVADDDVEERPAHHLLLVGEEAGTWWEQEFPYDALNVILDNPIDDPPAPEGSPDDPLLDQAWHLRRIKAQEAWGISQGDGVRIAIIDSGCNPAHPDLNEKCVGGLDVVEGNSFGQDAVGHGTNLAVLAAGHANNDFGTAVG